LEGKKSKNTEFPIHQRHWETRLDSSEIEGNKPQARKGSERFQAQQIQLAGKRSWVTPANKRQKDHSGRKKGSFEKVKGKRSAKRGRKKKDRNIAAPGKKRRQREKYGGILDRRQWPGKEVFM